jgi:hypothetical protein
LAKRFVRSLYIALATDSWDVFSEQPRRMIMQVETELEMVHRHIREGIAGIARQREVIADLRGAGHSTETPEKLLALYERVQRCHEAHFARLESNHIGETLAAAG